MPTWNNGYVCPSGAVALFQDEECRRLIRGDAIDSITTYIHSGNAHLHLRTGETVVVSFWIDKAAGTDPYKDFNEFCWDVEALIDGKESP